MSVHGKASTKVSTEMVDAPVRIFHYGIQGGCGSEKFEIFQEKKNIIIKYRSRWMGMDAAINLEMTGRIHTPGDPLSRLVITHVNDTELKHAVFATLIQLEADHEFDEGTKEMEGMVMGGVSVNEKSSMYNAIFLLDQYNSKEIPNEERIRCLCGIWKKPIAEPTRFNPPEE